MQRPVFHDELMRSWLAPYKNNVYITRREIHLSLFIWWPAGKHWEPNNAGVHRHAHLQGSSSKTFQRFIPSLDRYVLWSPLAPPFLSFHFDSPFCLSCSMNQWQCLVSCQLVLCYYPHSLRAPAIDLPRSLLSLRKSTSWMLVTFWLFSSTRLQHVPAHCGARRCVGNRPPWRSKKYFELSKRQQNKGRDQFF